MTEKHVVRFEPVGIEIEVDEDQNILRAAAEQGIMLMHGCKEGQCASCKSFILEGDDIEHDKYSTFALPDYRARGRLHAAVPGARLRRPHDRAAQLRRGDDPLRPADPAGRRGGGVQGRGHPRHAAPGAAADRAGPRSSSSPASTWTSRFPAPTRCVPSRWPTPPAARAGCWSSSSRSTRTGMFSRFLAEKLAEGDRLEITGPFGVFTLREGDNDLVFVGGGAGMAPILSLLRSMAERGLHAQGHLLLRRPDQEGSLLRGRAARAGGEATGLPLHTGPVRAGRRRGMGRRDRPDHRCGQAARQRPARGTRLRLRAAAHGGGGAPAARHAGRGGKAHLLRQVHDHW